MATAEDLRRVALALDGTVSAPHFDRTAFKRARTYATLAADGLTANFRFSPEEQALKCLTAPEVFAPIPNAWGRQGWTVGTLAGLTIAELESALHICWSGAPPKKGTAGPLAARSQPGPTRLQARIPYPPPPVHP